MELLTLRLRNALVQLNELGTASMVNVQTTIMEILENHDLTLKTLFQSRCSNVQITRVACLVSGDERPKST